MATLFVNGLTVMDFSYLHPQRGMVGESWIVDLSLSGELDEQGMIFDFGHIKRRLKNLFDEEVDHRLLVPANSELLALRMTGEQLALQWIYALGEIRMKSPSSAVLALPGTEINQTALIAYLRDLCRPLLPANVTQWEISLRQEDLGIAPFYHYSHGLKKHQGHCQRIAHGHRSRIEVCENGKRSRYWEKIWADRWEDIYIGTRDDLEGLYYLEEIPHYRFCYTSSEGFFELLIPEDHCYLIHTESTVEHLATHIARQLALESPGKHFQVRAFEGIDKGALAEAGPLPRR